MTSWWRVRREADGWDVMVFVSDGRVVACAAPLGIKIGESWKDARKMLDEYGFTSTMESTP